MRQTLIPLILASISLEILMPAPARAATYYWGSANTGTEQPTGATTTVSLGGTHWTLNSYDGSVTGNPYVTTATACTVSNDINFGGAAGTVNVDRPFTANDFAISSANYVFSITSAGPIVKMSSFSGSGISSATFTPDSSSRTLSLAPNTGGTANFSGVLADNGASVLTLLVGSIGGGILQLTGTSSTYTGSTTVSGGQLDISSLANGGSNSSLGKSSNAAANLVLASSIFNYVGSSDSSTDRLFTMAGSNGSNLTLQNTGTGALKFTNAGAIEFSTPNSTKTLTLGGTNSGENTLALAIGNNGSSVLTLAKTNAGRWLLTGTNSYTGATAVSDGTLQFGTVASLYGGSTGSWTAGNLRVASGSTLAFNVGGAGEFTTGNVTTLLANLATSSNATTNGMAAGSVLGFDTTNAIGSFTISNAIADTTGTAGGARGVTKLGSGTLVLGGTNTYTGATMVNAGTLWVNGSTSVSSAVTVNSGAKLGGTGTVGGAISVSGTLAAGNSIGTLVTGNLSLTSTGALENELGRSGTTPVSDLVAVTGTVSLAAGADLKLTLFTGSNQPVTNDLFFLISNDGVDAISGVFTQLNGIATTLNEGSWFSWNSQSWQITYQANLGASSFTGGNDLALQVVPEPASSILIGMGLGLLLLRSGNRGGRPVQ